MSSRGRWAGHLGKQAKSPHPKSARSQCGADIASQRDLQAQQNLDAALGTNTPYAEKARRRQRREATERRRR